MKFRSKREDMDRQVQNPFSEDDVLETSERELEDGSLDPSDESDSSLPGGSKWKGKLLKLKEHKKKIIIIAILAVAIIGGGILKNTLFGNVKDADSEYTMETVGRRDIVSILSGSGTLEAADSYTVTAMVKGEILQDYFAEGDVISKDAPLYSIDSSDATISLEKAQLNLEKAQDAYNTKRKSLDDLNIKANSTGVVTELFVEAGDTVQSDTVIATIKNTATMSLKLPFGTDDADKFYIGQPAEVTLGGSFETLQGKVSEISGVEQVRAGYMVVRNVTIDVANPGGLSDSETATAIIGGAACADSGTFTYKDESQVRAGMSGEIASTTVKEGAWVTKDQTIARIDSEDLDQEIKDRANTLKDAQLSYDNQYDQLEDYYITSPIAGTVIQKDYKAGDKLEEPGKTLCIVYDLSYLTMTLNVDELDVSNVMEGQTVSITAEAVKDKSFEGVVTKVNINGTTSNGVTSYPVTIQIDEPDGLLPGMNVDAEIIVDSSTDVLAVPVDAITRGDRVLVQTDGLGSSPKKDSSNDDEGIENQGTMPQDQPSDSKEGQSQGNVSKDSLPAGFEYRTVTLGLNDDNYIEILEGLEEGDVIAIKNRNPSLSDESELMMGESSPREGEGGPNEGESGRPQGGPPHGGAGSSGI